MLTTLLRVGAAVATRTRLTGRLRRSRAYQRDRLPQADYIRREIPARHVSFHDHFEAASDSSCSNAATLFSTYSIKTTGADTLPAAAMQPLTRPPARKPSPRAGDNVLFTFMGLLHLVLHTT